MEMKWSADTRARNGMATLSTIMEGMDTITKLINRLKLNFGKRYFTFDSKYFLVIFAKRVYMQLGEIYFKLQSFLYVSA